MDTILKTSMIIEEYTKKINLNRDLNRSDLAYHKFILGITRTITKPLDRHELNCLHDNFKLNTNISILKKFKSIFFVSKNSIKIYFAYVIISLYYKLILKNNFSTKELKNNEYILVTPIRQKSKIYLLLELFSSNLFLINLLNSNIALVSEFDKSISNKKNCIILNYFTPGLQILFDLIHYSFINGYLVQNLLQSLFDKTQRKINIKEFHDQYCKMIIYNFWAKKSVNILKNTNKNSLFIFEADFGGQSMALVEELNINKMKTIHLQHGNYFSDNIFYVPPLCKYMLCCSERERNIQIDKGMTADKIFVYGAPLQTIRDSNEININSEKEFDIVILGGGPKWDKTEIKNLLNRFHSHYSNLKVNLRHHPIINKEYRSVWEDLLPNANISNNKDLYKDIHSGDIIIAFSVDVLVSCLRNMKKTIFCVPFHKNNNKIYQNLTGQNFLRLADTCNNLIDAVDFFKNTSNSKISKAYIDYNFGESETIIIEKNIKSSLYEIKKS